MKTLLMRYATPFVTGLFLVSLISGLALFFGWQRGAFHEMHEILSLVLIIPFVLHIWRNWRPMVSYLKRRPMAIAIILSILMSIPFAWEGLQPDAGRAGGPPPFAIARMLAAQPLSAVAPALGQDVAALSAQLEAAGFAGAGAESTLSGLAEAAGRPQMEVLAVIAGR